MARIIKCDICGKECNELIIYTLIQHRLIREDRRLDICYDCIDEIKKELMKIKKESKTSSKCRGC